MPCAPRSVSATSTRCGGHSSWMAMATLLLSGPRRPLPPPTWVSGHIRSCTPRSICLCLSHLFPAHSAPSLTFYDVAATHADAWVSKGQSNLPHVCHLLRKLGLGPPAAFSRPCPLAPRTCDQPWGPGFRDTKAQPPATPSSMWTQVCKLLSSSPLALAAPTGAVEGSHASLPVGTGLPARTSGCSINVSIWTPGPFSNGRANA